MDETDGFINGLFGPESRLANEIPGHESRATQIRMARLVAEAALSESHLVVEAATGTGKTLAYLLPLLAMGRRVVVSTATKALQDQIIEKDLPLVRRVVNRVFTVASLKGRANYLCLYRLRSRQTSGESLFGRDAKWLGKLATWAERTPTGDKDEWPDSPENLAFWLDVSAGGNHCPGRQCAYFEDCFLTRARERAKKASLVVVNHYLYFADLAVKEGGFGEILPQSDVVVFDEAHRIPDIVTAFFGWEISTFQIENLIEDCRREAETSPITDPEFIDSLAAIEEASAQLRGAFPKGNQRGGLLAEEMQLKPGRALVAVEGALYRLRSALEAYRSVNTGWASCGRRVEEMLDISGRIRTLEDPSRVRWFETRGLGVFLTASPLETGPTFCELLYPRIKTCIFTSATLATGADVQSFAFFLSQLGLRLGQVVVERLPPAFDYQKRTILYVPNHMPDPGSDQFPEAVAKEIATLVAMARGRTLCLFTSFRMMAIVQAELKGRLPYLLLVQGDRSKASLLEAFKADVSSVLLGVASFWEGVDIPGEALSMVIVDRLPFASPGDPLVAARGRWLQAQKLNPFTEMSVPKAILALKQGLGRLLRRADDQGVLVVLDPRLSRKWYGRLFFAGLPPSPVTHDLEAVRRFFL